MAQYYHKLSQEDKSNEEVAQFYPNINENQTVQNDIAADETQQQFQDQPVVVSSDQLMVVEKQNHQVIIDQSQAAYHQPSSYVKIQELPVEFQNQEQVTNTSPNQSVVVEQPATPQPVVLNHQLMQNQMSKVSPIHQNCPTGALEQEVSVPQIKRQNKSSVKQNGLVPPQRVFSQGIARQVTSNYQKDRLALVEEEDDEDEKTVTLTDKRMINYTHRIFITQRKQSQARLASQSTPNFPQNQMPQKQQMIIQEFQNQYLIQPKKSDSKPQIQHPLPQFLNSSQIQYIIDIALKSEEYSDSVRMLVLQDNGEQRIITFTLPKGACTIQEILEAFGIPFTKDSPIHVTEVNSNGINYLVGVGKISSDLLESSEEINVLD